MPVLGTHMNDILNKMEQSTTEKVIILDKKKKLRLGIAHIPEVLLDNTDRNRTSPFAFTGNRFEFRAVGSSANCSSAMTALNAAVAAQLMEFKASVDAKIAQGETKERAIFEVLKEYIRISKPIRFEGNGYSEEWRQEAKKRGLNCETSVPEIFRMYTSRESVEMFALTGVMSRKELEARNEVKWEIYTKKIQIEARVLGDLAVNHVIPIATRYQSLLLDNVYKIKAVYPPKRAKELASMDAALIEEIAGHVSAIKCNVDAMIEARKVANRITDEYAKAVAYHDKVWPYFDVIRYHADKLELIVDDEMWSLPKYRELLFIR